MVITVTLNPAMDKTLFLEKLSVGSVNRVTQIRHDIGGKGINVSKVLREFKIDSVCTGFLGGTFEEVFKSELDKRNIKHKFVSIEENTRVNTKIIDMDTKTNTDINELGPNITLDELEEFLKIFENLCSENDIVVLAGKVSPGIPNDIYGRLTKLAKLKGAFVIIDAEGELLKEGIREAPFAIKPNRYELETILNRKLTDKEDIIYAAKQIINNGVKKILVSMGNEGSLLITEKEVLLGKGISVPTKNTVGAGDSMVAALVYSLINNFDNRVTLAFAQSSGAATVMLEGTEACTLESVEMLLPESTLNIEKIK